MALLFGMSIASMSWSNTTMINASGSSFVYPLMSQWTSDFYKTTGIKINYQPIGSSGGINQLQANTISFAASDQPLTSTMLRQKQWSQFPIAMGGIVPVINLKGVSNNQLILDGSTLANIYLGKDKYWDATDIKALNPHISLPHKMIIAIHRADGSGTTYNFTYYLAQVSQAFNQQVGVNTLVSWPGMGIGGKGNAGVANQVQSIPGSIGYVEYAYAFQSNLTTIRMKNKAGQVVIPSLQSFAAAAIGAKWSAKSFYYLILANQGGENAWPIVATTFILYPTLSKNKKTLHQFFNWVFTHGNPQAKALHYVAVPGSVYRGIPLISA